MAPLARPGAIAKTRVRHPPEGKRRRRAGVPLASRLHAWINFCPWHNPWRIDWRRSPWRRGSRTFLPRWWSRPAPAAGYARLRRRGAGRARALDRPPGRRPIGAQSGVTLIGGGRVAADWAAFANGVHIRYLDCNDTYLSLEPAHPSDNWAAVMAAGETAGADGADWITAAAVAYEVQCRLCDAASIRARAGTTPPTARSPRPSRPRKLLGLDHEQTVHALGIAGTTGTALRLTRAGELSMWKGCAFAFAARNGSLRRPDCRAGMTGPAPLFEGDMGFFQQVSGPFSSWPSSAARRGDWMLPRTSIKFVPAEYHSQSAIAAAFALRTKIGDPRRIRAIEIATFRTAVEIIGQDPRSGGPRRARPPITAFRTARPSHWSTAQITAEQFTAERLADPPCSTSWPGPRSSRTSDSRPAIPRPSPTGCGSTSTTAPCSSRRSPSPWSRQEPAHRRPARRQVPRPGRPGPGLLPRASQIIERVSRLDRDLMPHETLDLLHR